MRLAKRSAAKSRNPSSGPPPPPDGTGMSGWRGDGQAIYYNILQFHRTLINNRNQ